MIPQALRAAASASQLGLDPQLPFTDPQRAADELVRNYVRQQYARRKKTYPGPQQNLRNPSPGSAITRYLKGGTVQCVPSGSRACNPCKGRQSPDQLR